jgi:Fe-S cluster assembly iron-binding protein IscA
MNTDSNPDLSLRITVESGGCHGFQYLMSVTNSQSDIDLEEDTLFVYDSDGEVARESSAGSGGGANIGNEAARNFGKGRAKVVMDSASLELLEGSKVDYTMELIGSQFKIVDNPRATSSCGCGTSFDVKI